MTDDRHDSTRGTWRLVRGAVVGVSAGALGLSAHMAGGASTPTPSLWLALTAGAVALSVLASRWRWTMPGLLLVLLFAQVGFHAVFEAYGAHAGHVEHAGHLASPVPADGALAKAVDLVSVGDTQMLVAHVIAAVVLAALMRFGESGLRAALDVLLLRVVRLVTTCLSGLSGLPEVNQRPCAAVGFVAVTHDPARVWGSRAPPQ